MTCPYDRRSCRYPRCAVCPATKERPMTTRQECGDGVSIAMIGDGSSKRHFGNFLGIIFVPPQGGWEWHALNGDWGECYTEVEAIAEIKAAWKRG